MHTGVKVFIAALFINDKTWKQPGCPSVSVDKLRQIQTIQCYSKEMSFQAMKRYGGILNEYY